MVPFRSEATRFARLRDTALLAPNAGLEREWLTFRAGAQTTDAATREVIQKLLTRIDTLESHLEVTDTAEAAVGGAPGIMASA